MIQLLENFSLEKYNTFGIDVLSKYFINFQSINELKEKLYFININNALNKLPKFILGGGSNILFTNNLDGIVIHPENKEITVLSENNQNAEIQVDAGLEWDYFVQWSLNNGYYGLENLSYIPGTVGASPVQNIGAYGKEAKDFILSVNCLDFNTLEEISFLNHQCNFDYRNSIFKNDFKDKYLIINVIFKLKKNPELFLEYGNLKDKLSDIQKITPLAVRDLIIKIRKEKLPEPSIVGNAGSFFKNPVVTDYQLNKLKIQFPELISFDAGYGKHKLAAGQLIEICGLKGKSLGNAQVYPKQALILVNNGVKSGKEIVELASFIQNTVYQTFNINLEIEVNII